MQCIKNPHMSLLKVFEESIMTLQHPYSFMRLSTQTETLLSKPSTQLTSYKVSMAVGSLARRWREVQGSYDWENLIEPLDPLLQLEIIRYAMFVAACYNAFDIDPNSQRYLTCKYGKKSMFEKVDMGDSGYEVTKYIYVTLDINVPILNESSCGRWVGYIAVSSDDEVKKLGRRDLVVTFRGTVTYSEWIANLMSSLTPARLDPQNPRLEVKVETGILRLYTSNESESRFRLGSCREQLLSEISRLLGKYSDEEVSITITGHSMGSSLALLLAYDLAELGLDKINSKKVVPITVFSFGGPRVGNCFFKERCDELGIKVLRIVNSKDPITKLPGLLFNENLRNIGVKYDVPLRRHSCYVHVGVELVLDYFKMEDIFNVHALETYIDMLKSPKRTSEFEENMVDMCNKAKEMIMKVREEMIMKVRNVDMSPWRDCAINIVNKVMSNEILKF